MLPLLASLCSIVNQGLQGKKEFDGAKECLSALLQAEPGNSSAQKLLASVQKGRAREKAGQKAMVW